MVPCSLWRPRATCALLPSLLRWLSPGHLRPRGPPPHTCDTTPHCTARHGSTRGGLSGLPLAARLAAVRRPSPRINSLFTSHSTSFLKCREGDGEGGEAEDVLRHCVLTFVFNCKTGERAGANTTLPSQVESSHFSYFGWCHLPVLEQTLQASTFPD